MDWTYIIKFIGVAVSIFIVDICWAKYFIYVNKHKPLPASLWGSIILLFGAFATIEYVNDKTLIVAAFIGGFFGTYLTVWLEKKEIRKTKMTISESKQRVINAGITQLRKGETLKDVLDYLDGKLPGRKGYDYKHDDGSLMSKNEMIRASNKEAFAKSFTSAEYGQYSDKYTEDNPKEDQRQDTTLPGVIQPCQYCGVPLRTDDKDFDILNCEDCMSEAIYRNCM